MKRDDISANIFVGLCFLAGAAGAAGGIYLIWGGFHLPSGRYPIILLILLFAGPPIIGALAGFFAAGFLGIGIGILLRKRRATAEKHNKRERFRRAVTEGDVAAIEAALKEDNLIDAVPVDANGNYAVHVASMNGQAAIVEILVAQGSPWRKRNNEGKTMFEVAPPGKADAIWNAFCASFARRMAKTFGQPAREALYQQWLRHWLTTQFAEATTDGKLPASRVAQGFVELAAAAADKGNRQEAITALDAAIELDAGNADALLRRAQFRLEEGDAQGALRDANACISVSVASAEAHGLRGMACEKLQRNDDAMKAYQKALELDPGNELYQQRLNELIMS